MNEQTAARENLYFLWHPGTTNIFSGYGLAIQRGRKDHLVGLLMVDRPHPVDPAWLASIEATFGGCELVAITKAGERGLACQMWIEPESQQFLRQDVTQEVLATEIAQAIRPLLQEPPKPRLRLGWDESLKMWMSQFQEQRDEEE